MTKAGPPQVRPVANQSAASAVADLKKTYGEGVIMRFSDKAQSIAAISTGALTLDIAIGIGGVPRGRIVQMYGPPSCGKSTLAQTVVANAQAAGGMCAYVDAEHCLDPTYAKAIGVNLDELLISQPDYGEQGLQVVDKLVASGAFDVIVIDSVAAFTPRAEIEGEMGDSHVGLHARMWGQAMRKLVAKVEKTDTCLILINQLREKIGVMFGSPEVTPGGKAIPFYSAVNLDVRRIETTKEGGEAVGNRTRVKVTKNKVGPPYRQAEFEIEFGVGINTAGCLLDVAVDMGLIKKSGTWFSYEGSNIGQGRSQAADWLKENTTEAVAIRSVIGDTLGF